MNSHAGAVLDQLDRLFNRGTIAGLSEGTLLERYVAEGDEAAFAALVARHGPMVLGVCRRILRDERDVEDAFQATFLVLVRRAGAVRDGELVGRWLHGVAHRVAVGARAHSARRFAHEQSVNEPAEPEVPDSAAGAIERRELAAVVDEELMRLPSTLRAPVVLCYLEGLSHEEAARRLRWPVGTVRSRMARAREILRHRLARLGVMADGPAILASLASPPVPPEWIDATVRGSLHFAARSATAAATIASARSVAIARRVLQTMLMTKLSYIGAAGLGLVLAFGGVRTLAFQGPGEAKPIGLASVSAQKSGDRSDARIPPTPSDRPSDRQLASSVLAIGEDLDRAMRQLAGLQDRLRKLESELDPVRGGRPTGVPGSPRAPSSSEARAKPEGAPNRPRYIYSPFNTGRAGGMVQNILVMSPNGSRVASFDTGTGKSTPVKMPEIKGVRREILSLSESPRPKDVPAMIGFGQGTWFLALDLDRADKVTRIAAFSIADGTWIDKELPEPVDRSSLKMISGNWMLALGRHVDGVSIEAKKWGELEIPAGTELKPFFLSGLVMIEKEGWLYRFDYKSGTWDDIYHRSIEGQISAPPDSRPTPVQ